MDGSPAFKTAKTQENKTSPLSQLSEELQKHLQINLSKLANSHQAIDSIGSMNCTQQSQSTPQFLFVSSKTKKIINDCKCGKIDNVPLDSRIEGKKIFYRHIDNNKKAYGYNPATLLSNYGFEGSGKSVQQVFKMMWFVDHFKNGVAIEITDEILNLQPDTTENQNEIQLDASDFKIKPRNPFRFISYLIRGVILRLIEFCFGTNYSTNSTQIMKKYLSWNFAETMRDSLYFSLQFVREILGLPDTAPILLAIDELAMKQKMEDEYDLRHHIRTICSQLDNSDRNDAKHKRNRTFWISFSAKRCESLVNFINLQLLPPIFPITQDNLKKFDILPPLLQCFKKENLKMIDWIPEKIKIIKSISEMLMNCGGNPGRFNKLLKALHTIKFDLGDISSTNTCCKQNSRRILEEINKIAECMNKNSLSKIPPSFLKNISEVFSNMVQPFIFDNLEKETMEIIKNGYGSFISLKTFSEGLLFVPYPILQSIEEVSLNPLIIAMNNYFHQTEKKDRVKNLKRCICAALNFYAANMDLITLKNICRVNGGDPLFNWNLKKFPASISEEKMIDLDNLADFSPGFYHPTDKYKKLADVVGILDLENREVVKRLILFIQVKDWFDKDVGEKKNIIDEWRWTQQFATESDVFLTKKSKLKSLNRFNDYWEKHPEDKPVHIIFTVNAIEVI